MSTPEPRRPCQCRRYGPCGTPAEPGGTRCTYCANDHRTPAERSR